MIADARCVYSRDDFRPGTRKGQYPKWTHRFRLPYHQRRVTLAVYYPRASLKFLGRPVKTTDTVGIVSSRAVEEFIEPNCRFATCALSLTVVRICHIPAWRPIYPSWQLESSYLVSLRTNHGHGSPQRMAWGRKMESSSRNREDITRATGSSSCMPW
jgi:hypothetical protein